MYLASNNGVETYTPEKTPECLSNELIAIYKKHNKTCNEEL